MDVAQTAVRVLPLPVRAAAEQPAIDAVPSLKLTLPVGAKPVTDAVNVTLAPTVDGLPELERVVDVADLTTCDSALLVDATFPASPP